MMSRLDLDRLSISTGTFSGNLSIASSAGDGEDGQKRKKKDRKEGKHAGAGDDNGMRNISESFFKNTKP